MRMYLWISKTIFLFFTYSLSNVKILSFCFVIDENYLLGRMLISLTISYFFLRPSLSTRDIENCKEIEFTPIIIFHSTTLNHSHYTECTARFSILTLIKNVICAFGKTKID